MGEMLHHPPFSGIPNKGDKIKAKKNKKAKKMCHGVPDPTYSPADCPHWGLNTGPSSCRGTALPTRVWPCWTSGSWEMQQMLRKFSTGSSSSASSLCTLDSV